MQKIDGNVLIDTSIFASHDKAPGWPWNDMTQCFSAPPSAAIVDRNCFSISLYSAPKPDDLAFIRVASYYPVTMFSQSERWQKAPRMRNIANWMWCPATLTASRLPGA